VNTEITENKLNGWVLYDGECRLCTGMARRFHHLLAGRHLELLPLQTPWVKERLHLPEDQLLKEMRLLRPDGKYFGGADAILEIGRYFWWAWPLRMIGHVPVIKRLLEVLYRHVARNRNCTDGVCEIKKQSRAMDLLPLVALPCFALLSRSHVAAWVFMWAMAFALYAGCKWLTYRETRARALRRGLKLSLGRIIAYLLAWPGMDANDFLDARKVAARPRTAEWVFAIAKTFFGVIVLWAVTRTLLPFNWLLAGWSGMLGVVFILHFGLFHLLSLFWRRMGIHATPVMRNPIGATSLAEFWGGRWNTAFHELAFRFTFRPLRRFASPSLAMLLVFGLSGLIHEAVISLPARGGYGLPTLYFLIQGLGVIAERSRFGRFLGLGRGLRGWLFTFCITAGPVFALFHPPFVKHVILPMLTAIGAT
jgi:predicted DCC family thiol-disulfide oxidoreductase YuxK